MHPGLQWCRREILIKTVTGDVAAIAGRILAHEHLQIDLSAQKGPNNVIGAAEELDVIDDLRKAKAHGLTAIVDLSAPGWGRDPIALRRISQQTDIAVVCATGFYWDPFPDSVVNGSVEELRDSMIAEVTNGIGSTGIRCGVIKVGTARGMPGEMEARLFAAAAGAASRTGAAIITHTSSPDQASWHVKVLDRAGMDLKRVVISHMGAVSDVTQLAAIARAGVYLGIDKISFPKGPTNIQLADLVRDACALGLQRQLILSSDVARKTFLHRHGGRSYSTVFADFVPMLCERGISQGFIDTMLCENPLRLLQLSAAN
jgi:phosphotriesterase-related protein